MAVYDGLAVGDTYTENGIEYQITVAAETGGTPQVRIVGTASVYVLFSELLTRTDAQVIVQDANNQTYEGLYNFVNGNYERQ